MLVSGGDYIHIKITKKSDCIFELALLRKKVSLQRLVEPSGLLRKGKQVGI